MSEKDELDVLLEQWQDVPSSDPQLKHRVWTRIASGDSPVSQGLPEWLTRISGLLARPIGATAFVAASVVCGIFIGQLRVNQAQSARTEELAQNYIQLIEAQTQNDNEESAR